MKPKKPKAAIVTESEGREPTPDGDRLKLMTVVGTRPEIIRLSRVLPALDRHLDHTLVHTGQNYDFELNQLFFEDLQLRPPDRFLNAAGATAARTCGNVISSTDEAIAEIKPDALLVLGDTNSCLAAYAAKRRRIPVFHMEAGNRCFDERVPEEINRRLVDHISDINLCYSDIAREYLLREGLPPDRVIKTGSPMREVLAYYSHRISSSDVLNRLELTSRQFYLVSVHREENVDDQRQLGRFVELLTWLAERDRRPIIVSTHPRTRKRMDAEGVKLPPLVRLEKPLSYTDYVKLQTESIAVLSDSGTIAEESSILNFPALNLREAHERPEAMEEASVMMVGMRRDTVAQALAVLQSQGRGTTRTIQPVGDYETLNVSEKVLRIILSYTDYVQRAVWRSEPNPR
jgi:UDP-N-acetylglucosamine 2-epimerase (non-hydrolysing)